MYSLFSKNKKSFVKLLCIPAILLSPVLTTPSNAGVVLKERSTFYNVKGLTGRQIFRGFGVKKSSSKKTLNFGGRHAIASTDFVVDVKNIRKTRRRNSCVIADADIVISVNYTFPRWVDEAKASPNMRNEWAKFMQYVVWHEKHHVNLAQEFAGQYLHLIKQTKYPLLEGCASLPDKARARLKKLVKLHENKQKLFDRKENQVAGKSRQMQVALKRAK